MLCHIRGTFKASVRLCVLHTTPSWVESSARHPRANEKASGATTKEHPVLHVDPKIFALPWRLHAALVWAAMRQSLNAAGASHGAGVPAGIIDVPHSHILR
jgi:hypothetical protein